MNRAEHLLVILAEECAEASQRASKALRFGLDEVQPGQNDSNAVRLHSELQDLVAAVEMLSDEGVIPVGMDRKAVNAKKLKVEEFLKYSAQCGTLEVPA